MPPKREFDDIDRWLLESQDHQQGRQVPPTPQAASEVDRGQEEAQGLAEGLAPAEGAEAAGAEAAGAGGDELRPLATQPPAEQAVPPPMPAPPAPMATRDEDQRAASLASAVAPSAAPSAAARTERSPALESLAQAAPAPSRPRAAAKAKAADGQKGRQLKEPGALRVTARTRPLAVQGTVALAVVAAVVGAAWAWQRYGAGPAPAVSPESFGAPIPATPKVAPVDAPLPSQAASEPVLDGPTQARPPLPAGVPLPDSESPAVQPAQPPIRALGTPLPLAPVPPGKPLSVPQTPQGRAEPSRAGQIPSGTPEAKPNSLIALSEDQRRAPAAASNPATGTPSAPASAVMASPASGPALAANPTSSRTLRYGESGILVLTSNGVVVFDRAKGTQREVPVGQALPDGSVVKAVTPAKHLIDTDRGLITLR